jgi:acetyl-CoA carboxylase carboxyl transferase subunit alpha
VEPEVNSEASAETAVAEPDPAWRRVLLARHPKRPHALDYAERILADFQEIHGDRSFGDDPAIVAAMAQFEGRPVMLVAEQHHQGKNLPQFRYAQARGVP